VISSDHPGRGPGTARRYGPEQYAARMRISAPLDGEATSRSHPLQTRQAPPIARRAHCCTKASMRGGWASCAPRVRRWMATRRLLTLWRRSCGPGNPQHSDGTSRSRVGLEEALCRRAFWLGLELWQGVKAGLPPMGRDSRRPGFARRTGTRPEPGPPRGPGVPAGGRRSLGACEGRQGGPARGLRRQAAGGLDSDA
jgi:hypothetical protein